MWIFDNLSKENGQNGDFLDFKLLEIFKISKNIPSLQVPQIEHPVVLCIEGQIISLDEREDVTQIYHMIWPKDI